MKYSTAVVAALSFLSNAHALDLTNNAYIKGESVLNRSPCPAINTVANHGFVNRDGLGVLSTDLAEALTLVFGVDISFSLNAISSQVEKGLPADMNDDGTFNIDLFSWYGQFDHDASLMRSDLTPEDPQPQFNQTLFDKLAMLSEDGETVTKEQLAEHQRNMVKASRKMSPDDFNIPVNTCGTQATFTMLFGDDDNLDTARLDFIESFMKDNRIPEDYMTREERGVPNLLSEDDTITNGVRAMFNSSIEMALEADLDGGDMAMDDGDEMMVESSSNGDSGAWSVGGTLLAATSALAMLANNL
ncbi:MAG: hypothetical protein SGARI_005464 [Bacillariaceae sp.]